MLRPIFASSGTPLFWVRACEIVSKFWFLSDFLIFIKLIQNPNLVMVRPILASSGTPLFCLKNNLGTLKLVKLQFTNISAKAKVTNILANCSLPRWLRKPRQQIYLRTRCSWRAAVHQVLCGLQCTKLGRAHKANLCAILANCSSPTSMRTCSM